jgi:predicted AAA+ superfamily ATPase
MYIKRHMERAIEDSAGIFGALLVTGARQVGKTTLLTQAFPKATYLNFDDAIVSSAARRDPRGFLMGYRDPVIIDEIQYVPELLPVIKMQLDIQKREGLALSESGAEQEAARKAKGRYLLTGSQQFRLMKGVSESLAGRMAIHTLLGVSLREICNDDFNDVFLPTSNYLEKRRNNALKTWSPVTVWDVILRGSMPELVANPEIPTSPYYGSYINTYLERDVRSLAQVGDLRLFNNFMVVLAARTGRMLNMSNVASDVGVSVPTAKRWLSVLEASNIIYLLRPYYTNISKRAIKTPKLYFLDTGLAAHLTGWTTPDVMRRGAMAGAFFETFVIAEVLKSFYNKGVVEPPLYYYRDQQKNEIDLLIVQDGKIRPIEIKASASPQANDIRAFAKLEQFRGSGVERGEGALICLYDKILPLSDSDKIIPLGYL